MWFAMLAINTTSTDKVDCYKATNKKLPYKESCDIFLLLMFRYRVIFLHANVG